MMFMITNWQIC